MSSSSSRTRALKDSTYGFCQVAPGSMNAVAVVANRHQSVSTSASCARHPPVRWDEVDAVAAELGPFGPIAIFCVGTGVRPEEAFGADWSDVNLEAGVFTIRRAYAKGKLKTYVKTVRSRRRVPIRAKVIASLETLSTREGILFPAAGGSRIDINNWCSREWTPALKAAGVERRRIYDMRHAFATWSLAAGTSIFTLGRRMGTSVPVIDATYGHLAIDADGNDRKLLDAYYEAHGPRSRHGFGRGRGIEPPRERRNRAVARFQVHGRGGFRTCDLSRVKRALSH